MYSEQAIISPLIKSFPNFSPPIRLGIMASGEGSNFEAIAKAISTKTLKATIPILIVNNPDCKAINRAKRLNIPHLVIDHRDFKSRDEFEIKLANTLKKHNVELIIMAGWMRIVTNTLISRYQDRIINIHPSLLPSFPGIRSVDQAIDSGVKITGATVHIVTSKVDCGPILSQGAVEIDANDSRHTLMKKIQQIEHHILPIGLQLLAKECGQTKDKNYQ